MEYLKYGFCKKYFDRYEPLTSADLEKNGGQKCSTGQRSISIKVLLTKSILWLFPTFSFAMENAAVRH